MDIIIMSGGLGNQMFQYAFYLALQTHKNDVWLNDISLHKENAHNGFELNELFGLNISFHTYYCTIIKIVRKLLIFRKTIGVNFALSVLIKSLKLCNIHIILESSPGGFDQQLIQPSLDKKKVNIYFGYWQSEKYFLDIQTRVLESFSFQKDLSEKSHSILNEIKENESVAIHIRRGDYLEKENHKLYGNICTINYYEKALQIIQERLPNAIFYIFSDDPDWVKKSLSLEKMHMIDWNKKEDSWQDLFLMSQCKHNIIANSTFSWWGAWLNKNPDKIVISPSKFINGSNCRDRIPEKWIKI